MPEYRRWFVPGGTVFLTVVTYDRAPLFADPADVDRLRRAISAVRSEWVFEFSAAVVLPDHVHFLWALPPGDAKYPKRIGRMKALFTKSLSDEDERRSAPSESRRRHRESGVWQRRYLEHTIRDEDDFKNHLDYIHYNPVKHGLVACPHAWPWSSFGRWVAAGEYTPEWGCSCGGQEVRFPHLDQVAPNAGE
jgi:putative transposase